MRRNLLNVAVSLVFFLGMIYIPGQAASAAPKPFKIGYVGGFTGPLAIYNVQTLKGVKYAIEEANQAGGFQGRKIEIIVRDGKSRPDVSMSEARNLVLGEEADILMGVCSGAAALAVSSFAKEQKKLYLPCPGGTMLCGKDGHRYIFKPAGMSADHAGYSVGEYLSEKPWKKYYLIGSDYVFAHQVLGFVWERLKKNKPEVEKVGEFWPKMVERDFTSYVTGIMAAQPEAVIALLPGTAGMDFIRQAKGYGFFDKTHYVTALLNTSDTVPLGRETPEGIVGLTEYPFPYAAEMSPLAEKLQDRYDKDSKDRDYTNIAIGYDTFLFLREAIKKADSTETEKIVDSMEGLEIDTAVGRIKCLPYSHAGTVPIFVGMTTYSDKYPFAILKDIKKFQGQEIMVPEDEIRKMRGE